MLPRRYTTIEWHVPEERLPLIPANHVCSDDVYVVRTNGKSVLARLFAGRPLDGEDDGWDFRVEVQGERHWLEVSDEQRSWKERLITTPIERWTPLPE